MDRTDYNLFNSNNLLFRESKEDYTNDIYNDKEHTYKTITHMNNNPFLIKNFSQDMNEDFPSPQTFIGSFSSSEDRNYDTDYLSMMRINGESNYGGYNHSNMNNMNNNTNHHINHFMMPRYENNDIEMNNYSEITENLKHMTKKEEINTYNIANNNNNEIALNDINDNKKDLFKNIKQKNKNFDNIKINNLSQSQSKNKLSKFNKKSKKQIHDVNENKDSLSIISQNTNNINNNNSNSDSSDDENNSIVLNSNAKISSVKRKLIEEALTSNNLELSLKEINTCFGDTSQNLSLMQEKLEKLQFLDKKRGKASYKSDENYITLSNLIKQTKEDIKMEKNRISAKRSRDKQKKKLEDLESLTTKLKQENLRLYEQNEMQKKLMIQINCLFSRNLCQECFNKYDTTSFSKYVKNAIKSDAEYNTDTTCEHSHNNEENSVSESDSNISKNKNSNNNSNNTNYSISMSNNSSFSPVAKVSIFAGILFLMCFVGMTNIKLGSNNSNSNINSFNTGVKSTSATSNYNGENKENNKRMLLTSNDNNAYTNFDFSEHIDLQNMDNLKAINNVISRTGMEYLDKPKIIFETYKEIKKRNIASLTEKEYKEILK